MAIALSDALPDGDSQRVVAVSLLINCALDKRNAQLMCADDGQGMALLFTRAFARRDVLLMKLVRNMAHHDDAVLQGHLIVSEFFIYTIYALLYFYYVEVCWRSLALYCRVGDGRGHARRKHRYGNGHATIAIHFRPRLPGNIGRHQARRL